MGIVAGRISSDGCGCGTVIPSGCVPVAISTYHAFDAGRMGLCWIHIWVPGYAPGLDQPTY
jgi:hypothetical protein